MSQSETSENLLIDFNNISVSNEQSHMDEIKLTATETVNDSPSTKRALNQILYSSQPLYKLLTESNDADVNNPFDHFDKQAGLSDDPFEIVENAALISADPMATASEMPEVKTATLISFDSTLSDSSRGTHSTNDSQSTICNETKLNDSVQNTSHRQMSATKNISQKLSPSSPSGGSSTRSKAKNSSVTLLKYSLSNSRLDLIATDNVSSSEEKVCANDALQKKQKLEMRRDSGTDDSFDDIWSTKPNLIDSQTEIDVDSDIDNDIAKLNIPMLKISMPDSQCDESVTTDSIISDTKESIGMRALNRSNILEKLASIKQQLPNSPASFDATAVSSSSPFPLPSLSTPSTKIQIHNQTVDVRNDSQSRENINNETISPAVQCSSIKSQSQSQQQHMPNNPDSLIENLQRLVDQCDDKRKQITAKNLLDDLSSILTKTIANEKINGTKPDGTNKQPPKIKRQGTFSIDRDSCSYLSNKSSDQDETISSNDGVKNETQVIDSEFSQMVKQIQNAFGSQQNINVLQTNDQPIKMPNEMGSVNPTFIVVMTQPPATTSVGYTEENAFSRFQRSRCQSLSLKERSLSATRANQQKTEKQQVHTTPMKSTISERRRSFGTITQLASETRASVKSVNQQPNVKPDAPKIQRRRSLQAQVERTAEPETVQPNFSNPITSRRSFQVPSMCSGIRPPSPKKNLNSGRSSNAPLRQSTHTMGAALARRKTFNLGETVKDSPLKMKTSYGIMKKPAVPPVTRNLKIRVSQSTTNRSTAPLRAVVPMKQVPLQLINDTVAPIDDKRKMSTLITSTPRSIPSPIKSKIKDPMLSVPALPQESPIQNLHEKNAYSSTPPNAGVQPTISHVAQRRRTISDYRNEVNSSVTVTADSNSGSKISSLKNATKTLATGLSRFTAKRMSSIGLKRPSSSGSKENKQP